MDVWVPHDVRDEIVDFVNYWSERGELEARRIVGWVGIGPSKFFSWKKRFGKVNEHNAPVPRDHWITEAEHQAILAFEAENPTEGYRRLTFMMVTHQPPRPVPCFAAAIEPVLEVVDAGSEASG